MGLSVCYPKTGFELKLFAWMKLPYKMPIAKVRVNGALSELYKLIRGMRRGCPFSPIRFALGLWLLDY